MHIFFSFLEQLESYCRLAGFMTLPFQSVSFCPIVVDKEFEHLIKVGSIRFSHCQAYLFLFEISKQSVILPDCVNVLLFNNLSLMFYHLLLILGSVVAVVVCLW